MILRALFFLALAALLVPREPNLGLGRPGAAAGLMPAGLERLMGDAVGAPQKACLDHAADCAQMLGATGNLQDFALKRLAQVRSEIEADERARAERD